MIDFVTPFNLVRKSDRRQNADRRSAWRGSRREADVREFGQLPVSIEGVTEPAPGSAAAYAGALEARVAKYVH